jgi:aspartokinase
MGDTTDELVDLAYQMTDQPPAREFDILLSTGETVSSTLLAMALGAMGYEAVSLSGPRRHQDGLGLQPRPHTGRRPQAHSPRAGKG